jgi:hypothetical protein
MFTGAAAAAAAAAVSSLTMLQKRTSVCAAFATSHVHVFTAAAAAAAAAPVSSLTMLLRLTVMTRMMRSAAQAAMMTTMTCLASSPTALRQPLLVEPARSLRGGWSDAMHSHLRSSVVIWLFTVVEL